MYTTEIHGNPLPQRICLFQFEQETTRRNNFGTRTAKTGIVVEKETPHFLSLSTLFYENKTNEGFCLIAATLNVVNPKFMQESEIE